MQDSSQRLCGVRRHLSIAGGGAWRCTLSPAPVACGTRAAHILSLHTNEALGIRSVNFRIPFDGGVLKVFLFSTSTPISTRKACTKSSQVRTVGFGISLPIRASTDFTQGRMEGIQKLSLQATEDLRLDFLTTAK
jgi:hypothetical protein